MPCQHASGYFPLHIRHTILPVANLGSSLAFPLFLAGMFFASSGLGFLMDLSILFFGAAVAFSFVTLPVEFNASSRAMRLLAEGRFLAQQEVHLARKVLNAAALTYVAATAMALMQLVRLLILRGGSDE